MLTVYKTRRRLAGMIILMHKPTIRMARVARKLAWHFNCVLKEKIIK